MNEGRIETLAMGGDEFDIDLHIEPTESLDGADDAPETSSVSCSIISCTCLSNPPCR